MAKSRILALAACGLAALSLSACLSTGAGGVATQASCDDANRKLALAQAGLEATSAEIPALQATAQAALQAAGGNVNDRAYVTAQAVLAGAQAAIPLAQLTLAQAKAFVGVQCAAPSTPSGLTVSLTAATH